MKNVRAVPGPAALAAVLSLVLVLDAPEAPAQEPAPGRTASVFEAALVEPEAGTPDLSTSELRRLLEEGRAVLLDTRPHLEYSIGHIPGARNVAPKPGMPMSEYTSDVAEVGRLLGGDRSRPLVLYCNGPFCGKSRRVAAELLEAGYARVSRYQLGMPVWRALGGVTAIGGDGLRHVFDNDRTAWFVDARDPGAFASGSLPDARNVRAGEVGAAKDDGRLPMHDHNTRVIAFGADGAAARAVADELTANAFHNVAYFDGGYDELREVLAAAAAVPRAMNVAEVDAPAPGAVASATVHESEGVVVRVMRLAPGGEIAVHRHPSHDETFVLHRGRVAVTLNEEARELGPGDVAFIPAGTVVSGRNDGEEEAVVVVTFSRTGRRGPLTVPGRPGG